ncbi:interleukin-3 receptor subunit alpha [Neomonachus schauinslandi]|uniref:Interleukin-3 receptor subunit alpha n=1 Tax=Neomonachus schauinslandi TaxID=29088 RepID=A0A8M1M3L7_NEOSC|nr:interleukin-3 receptor subunit alpha [Neomonachus schauinslandi]
MALVWLTVFLTSVSGLLQSEEDPNLPIKNLRMEPAERRLTWDLHGNVPEILCFINSKRITKAIDNNHYCQFQVLPLCEVKNFTISLTKGPPFLMGIQYPLQEGNPGAAAQRLDCWVHDVDFLTCSWEVGREAPGDVQYRLYWQELRTHREQECPHYETDDRGKHVRCHFNDVSRLPKHLQILVRGTSHGASIPCVDRSVELSEIDFAHSLTLEGPFPLLPITLNFYEACFQSIFWEWAGGMLICFTHKSLFVFFFPPVLERLSSPNITATCNKSYSMMEWKVLSHVNHRFEYELQIQKGSNPAYTEKLQENFFQIHNPGNYMARLKVKGFFRNTWSEWSVPQYFGPRGPRGEPEVFADRGPVPSWTRPSACCLSGSPWGRLQGWVQAPALGPADVPRPPSSVVCDLGEDSRWPDWLLTALVLLGTLLVPGLAVVLCGRYSVLQKLFPPIPHMKDPITDNLQSSKLVAWEASRASREDCPVAEVQVLGET